MFSLTTPCIRLTWQIMCNSAPAAVFPAPTASPRFSVVVSAHQTEPWLPKAIASVEAQTFRDFEAILYVEESTDASLALCQAAAARDPRFRAVSAPKSGGVGATRNYGIDHAAGEYLVFLDGDDWLAPGLLAALDDKLRQTGPLDVLAFAGIDARTEDVDWRGPARFSNFRAGDVPGVVSGRDALRRAGRNGGGFRAYTWLSAYRTAFLRGQGLYQAVGLVMEDFEWTPRVWFAAERFAYIDEALYAYRRRPGSLTTEASPRVAGHIAAHFRSFLDFADTHAIPGDILSIWANQWLSLLYWFLFHPVTSRKIPDPVRREALCALLAGDGAPRLRKLVARASAPRRLAWPLVRLAARGVQFPAKAFFRWLYYPLAARRG